jgi:hypothetical protein
MRGAAALALIVPAVVAFIPFARTPPPSCGTMGGLAKVVLARNYAVFATQHGSSSEPGVLPALRQLVATEMGSQLGEFPPKRGFRPISISTKVSGSALEPRPAIPGELLAWLTFQRRPTAAGNRGWVLSEMIRAPPEARDHEDNSQRAHYRRSTQRAHPPVRPNRI